MNNHAKRLCTHLEALDFRRDYDAEDKTKARRVYRHANDMAQAIKVFDCMNDSTITIATRLANKIVGLGSNGPDLPSLKERAKVTRRKQKTQIQRENEARTQRAARAESEYEARQRTIAAEQRRREIEDLMRPGRGR